MRKLTSLIILVDLALAALALMLGNLMRFDGICTIETVAGFAGMRLVIFVLLVVFSSYFCEMYRWDETNDKFDLAARTAVAIMLAFFMLSASYYLLPMAMIGRGVLSSSLLIFGALQFIAHLIFMALMRLPIFALRVLILGAGPLAESVEKFLSENKGPYVLAGFIRPENGLCTVSDDKIVGGDNEIESLIKQEGISRLVVAITERRGVLPVQNLLRCKLNGVDIIDAASFCEDATRKLPVENISPSWFIYSDGFRITPFLHFIKRTLDIVLSLVGMILLLPVWTIVAFLVRCDSSGSIFFRQIRVGEREVPFTIYKFRTMRQDAEKETGAVWATENDVRITKVGKFLRKTRLDEFPQLFNVLKGEMSLVGPRPERPEFVEQLNEKIPYYPTRHFMKPGVTGWAQICYPYGASDEDALEKLRYDLYYIKNYTVLFDVLIILETVKVVLFGRGGR